MRRFYCVLALLLSSACLPVQAGLTIHGTRIVYDESSGETAVRIEHTVGNTPVLMQTWLDNGDLDASAAGAQNLPFLLVPAVARLNPGAAQVVRILRIRDELPKDRESLLYFNVLEIPPEPEESANVSSILFAMQARLKFFYRPKGLTMASWEAPDLLRFTPVSEAGQTQLRIHNSTPYHVTLKDLSLIAAKGGATLAKFDAEVSLAPMLEPFGEAVVPLKMASGNVSLPPNAIVHYSTINDQGGVNDRQKALGR